MSANRKPARKEAGTLPGKAIDGAKASQRAKMAGRPWPEAYLAILAETGVYEWACKRAGVTFSAVWQKRQKDQAFAAAEAESLKSACLLFEGEAIRRGTHGLRKYKFTAAGEPVMDPRTGEQYYDLEFSDTMLLAVLKGRIPEVYRDKLEQTGSMVHTHMTLEQFRERVSTAKANRTVAA